MKFYSFDWLRYLSLPFLFGIFHAKRVVNKEERSTNVSLPRLENATHVTGTQFTSAFGPVTVKKTYFVYILRSTKNKRFFIGTTDDLYGCLERHNTGRNITTIDMFPFELIYYEAYIYFEDAKSREKYLRSNAGQKFLKKNLSRYFKFTQPVNIHKVLRVVPYISLLLLTIIGPALFVLLMTPRQSIAAWFDDAWGYRKSLTITHNAALTNQKVKFDIDTQTLITNGQLQSDCGDSRFTDNNGNLLPYYLDSTGGACNTNSTDYYVLIPVVNNGTTVIYHYYGNPYAPNGTKGSQLDYPTLSPSGGAASAGSEERSPGPILYWKMDEGQGTTINDSSSTQNTGTFEGIWKTEHDCISGTCGYVVNGDNHLFSTGSLSSLSRLTTGTISVWAKFTVSNSFQSIFNIYRSADTTGTGITLSYDNQVSGGVNLLAEGSQDGSTKWSFNVSSTHFDAITETNKWHLYTLTHDGTTPALYIDGNAVPITFTTTTDKTVWLKGVLTDAGSDADLLSLGILWANSTPFFQATGFFDDFKIYPYLRSASQIKSDVISRGSNKGVAASMGNQETQFLNDGLVGYWKMDDSISGSTITDNSGNATTLTRINNPISNGGKFGLGTDMESGSANILMVPDNSTLSLTGSFTLASWIKPESVTGSTQFDIVGKWAVTDESYLLAQYGDEIRLYIDTASNYIETTAANLTTGTWYQIIGTYDATQRTADIYINGVKQITTTTGTIPATIGDGDEAFQIGAEDWVWEAVSASADDARQATADTVSITGTTMESNVTTEHIGVRFQTIAINQGQTVQNASLTFYVTSDTEDEPNHTIGGDDSDNCAAFTTTANDIDGRADTTATSTFTSADLGAPTTGGQYSTSAITSVVQEIIDRGGWASGNALCFVVTGSASSTRNLTVAAQNNTTLSEPLFTYTLSSSPNYYDGVIDDIRVYKKALSPSEARQLYNWAPGPVGWWKLDENSGATYYDSSGNENFGVQIGGSGLSDRWNSARKC